MKSKTLFLLIILLSFAIFGFKTHEAKYPDGSANGQLLFWNDTADTWEFTDVSELVWEDTGKNLGVGKSIPVYPLDVYRATGAAALRLESGGTGGGDYSFLWMKTANTDFSITAQNQTLACYDGTASGYAWASKNLNFGVGTSNPTSKLQIDVANNKNVVGATINQNDTTNNPVGVNLTNTGTGDSLRINTNQLVFDSSGNLSISGAVIANNLHPEQIKTVAATGADYSTIQAAINSITDASASKPYILEIAPGVYTENLTLKNYVHFKGIGTGTEVVIFGTSGTLVTTPSTSFRAENILFQMTPTASGAIMIDSSAGGNNQYISCAFVMQSATNGITGTVFQEGSDNLFTLQNSAIIYQMSGSAAGVNTHTIVNKTSTAQIVIARLNIIVSVGDIDDDVVAWVDGSTGQATYDGILANFTATNASYSGNSSFYFNTVSGNKTFARNNITMTSAGGGTGNFVKMDTTTNDGIVDTLGNNISVTGFDLNYFSDNANGDIVNSFSDNVLALSGSTGAGTVAMGTTAEAKLTGNSTSTIVPAGSVGAKVKINGGTGFVSSYLQRTTLTNTGHLKYVGTNNESLLLDGNIYLEPASATKNISVQFCNIHSHYSFTTTFTNATNVINEVGTALSDGDTIMFLNTAGTLPTEIRKDIVYYVVNKATNSFQVSYNSGGAAVAFTDDGTPTNSYNLVNLLGSAPASPVAANSPRDLVPHALARVETNDEIIVVISNIDDAVDIMVTNAYFRVVN